MIHYFRHFPISLLSFLIGTAVLSTVPHYATAQQKDNSSLAASYDVQDSFHKNDDVGTQECSDAEITQLIERETNFTSLDAAVVNNIVTCGQDSVSALLKALTSDDYRVRYSALQVLADFSLDNAMVSQSIARSLFDDAALNRIRARDALWNQNVRSLLDVAMDASQPLDIRYSVLQASLGLSPEEVENAFGDSSGEVVSLLEAAYTEEIIDLDSLSQQSPREFCINCSTTYIAARASADNFRRISICRYSFISDIWGRCN